MPARLIINADDFGLTAGVNRAIEELHQAGALTSATLMAVGPAFEDAVAISRRNPNLGVGCHVVLTDGAPVSPPTSIPSLLAPGGRSFRSSLVDFAHAALRGHLDPADIRTEALAQIHRLQNAGIRVTHLDTHKHTHLFPAVGKPLLDAAHLASVPAIRNPFEPPWSLRLGHGSNLRRLQIRLLRRLRSRFETSLHLHPSPMATTDGTVGVSATGDLDEPTLRQLFEHLPEGTWECVCHPGYNDADLDRVTTRLRSHRDIERLALLTVVPEASKHRAAPQLIHYGDLARLPLDQQTEAAAIPASPGIERHL